MRIEMQNVPKIVTDRLKVAPPAVDHPDADVLTAFSERSLPKRERAVVLDHLARCGDCREIVALVLPEAELAQAVVRPAPSGWLTWPALRWGFVAVGVFAIGAFGVMLQRRSARPSSMAYVASRPEAVAKVAENQAPPVPAAAGAESTKAQDKSMVPSAPVAGPSASTKAKPAVPAPKEFDRLEQYSRLQTSSSRPQKPGGIASGVSVGGPLLHGPAVAYQNARTFQNSNSAIQGSIVNVPQNAAPPAYAKQPPNAFLAANVHAPAPSKTVEVQSQPAQLDTQNQASLELPSQGMPLQPSPGGQGQTVERAKEPGLVLGASPKVAAANPTLEGRNFMQLVGGLVPSWTINSVGGLQRSFDQGRTWQSVDVNGSPAASASAAPAPAFRKVTDSKKDAVATPVIIPPVFRAVAANGANVWAGASGGLLYHSTDSGAHWTRIWPFSGTTVLTGDILNLDFPDAQHGTITTSTGEIWLTSDGGQSWQKQ